MRWNFQDEEELLQQSFGSGLREMRRSFRMMISRSLKMKGHQNKAELQDDDDVEELQDSDEEHLYDEVDDKEFQVEEKLQN